MTMAINRAIRPTMEEVVSALGLEPHPTCGAMHLTFLSSRRVEARPPPLGDEPHALGAALYFLVSSEHRTALHRIRSDQMYHFYFGDPLEVLLLYPDGRGKVVTMSDDLISGHRPQLPIPAATLHMSRSRGSFGFSLLGTTSWPSVQPQDVDRMTPEEAIAHYPRLANLVRDFLPG